MRTLMITSFALLGCLLFAQSGHTQATNPCPAAPATLLESFETNIAVVVLKAGSEVGTVSARTGAIAVKCRQMTDLSTGNKAQGIAVEITDHSQAKDSMLIDYDEMVPLQNALDYLSKLEVSVTPLTIFDATYTTKGGLRLAAIGTRRTGVIQFTIRDARTGLPPLVLSRQELAQFSTLLDQAKATLDGLRKG